MIIPITITDCTWGQNEFQASQQEAGLSSGSAHWGPPPHSAIYDQIQLNVVVLDDL